jgi:hypothetical protein
MQRDTHTALITDETAEAILARLEGKKAYPGDPCARISDYLLAGKVMTPDGQAWHGNAGNYRVGSSNIKSAMLEEAVLHQVAIDIRGDTMVQTMTDTARAAQQPGDGHELQAMQAELRDIEARIKKLTGLLEDNARHAGAAAEAPGRAGRPEGRNRPVAWLRLEDETRRAKALAAVKESDVRRMLDALAEDMAALDRDHLKDFLGALIEEVTLDPATRAGAIRYRIAQRSGVMLASPRGFEPRFIP